MLVLIGGWLGFFVCVYRHWRARRPVKLIARNVSRPADPLPRIVVRDQWMITDGTIAPWDSRPTVIDLKALAIENGLKLEREAVEREGVEIDLADIENETTTEEKSC